MEWTPTVSVEVVVAAWSELGLPRGKLVVIGLTPSLNVTVPQVTGFTPLVTVAVKVTG